MTQFNYIPMYGKPTYLREPETETENEEYMTFLAKDEERKVVFRITTVQ